MMTHSLATCVQQANSIVYIFSEYLNLGSLKLDDEVLESWKYVQPITVHENKSVFCAYWLKYSTDFGMFVLICILESYDL